MNPHDEAAIKAIGLGPDNAGPDHPVRKDDGLPAFPVIAAHDVYATGMTLRDYFAAKAMQAYITADTDADPDHVVAEISYRMADAMLIERAKK